jgi:hypothetical protein
LTFPQHSEGFLGPPPSEFSLSALPSASFFSEIIFRQFLAQVKTLGFLRFTRFSPDLRIEKMGAFLLSSTGLRVRYYIFPYLEKVGTGIFSQDNSVVWRYNRS